MFAIVAFDRHDHRGVRAWKLITPAVQAPTGPSGLTQLGFAAAARAERRVAEPAGERDGADKKFGLLLAEPSAQIAEAQPDFSRCGVERIGLRRRGGQQKRSAVGVSTKQSPRRLDDGGHRHAQQLRINDTHAPLTNDDDARRRIISETICEGWLLAKLGCTVEGRALNVHRLLFHGRGGGGTAPEPTYPGGMGRSPFTLAAAVTAALPGAEVTGARGLSANGDGRFDSAIATIADGRELAIRVADDDETSRELASEAIALRALTDGARAMLPFRAPAYVGETRIGDARALVTELLPGFQIEAAMVPAGRGAAESIGASIAAVHSLPTSVVRGAGLTMRSAEECRAELERLVDTAAATGRVPARLTVRWRDAVADDALWRFESTVTLGGVQATSFLFEDDDERGPEVIGLVGWHGLSVGDPAVDLSWLSAAPDASPDVHRSYAQASDRTPDDGLDVRARLHAELEFARWLVHGDAMHRSDIVDDAAALLDALAEGIRADDLSVIDARSTGVDSALDALDRVPKDAVAGVDTSMHTDAYNPEELWAADDSSADSDDVSSDDSGSASDQHDDERAHRAEMLNVETEDLSGVASIFTHNEYDDSDSDEAQRAARAALQRWKSSSSE